ncbi:hypothetical protein N8D56_21145 [Devosia sp. A8/3-2]|nr:hypothetical protein N8D56_21145 [Devosia sp. A8/3-2]
MIKFTLHLQTVPADQKSVEVEAPVLPRIGEYISHDKSGISGPVHSVQYWWDEVGKFHDVQVSVKR